MADNCKTCPHCGAPLPAEASFCPRCAQSVNRRRTLSPPSRGGRRTLRRIMPVLVLLLFLGGGTLWVWAAQPQVYEGTGEVTYPLSGVPYRLFLTNSAERPEPLPRREITTAVSGEPYRAPVLLYIDGGAGGAACMAQALADAGIAPEDVDYINAHGTSTPMNDSCETQAIHTTFGEHARKLMVSSTKSMTGHLLGAAGAVEAIFTALALKEGYVPATIGYQVPDPACDLDIVPNEGRKADIRIALSNSLGFGGHNAAVVLKKWEE